MTSSEIEVKATVVVSLNGLLDRLFRMSSDPNYLQLEDVAEGLFALNFNKADIFNDQPFSKVLDSVHGYQGTTDQVKTCDDLRMALVVAEADGRAVWLMENPQIEFQQVSDLMTQNGWPALPTTTSFGRTPERYSVLAVEDLVKKSTHGNITVIY